MSSPKIRLTFTPNPPGTSPPDSRLATSVPSTPFATPAPQFPSGAFGSLVGLGDVRTPAMQQLQEIFPDMSTSVVAAALAVHKGNLEAATNELLDTMSRGVAAEHELLARARSFMTPPASAPPTVPTPSPVARLSAAAPSTPPVVMLAFRTKGYYETFFKALRDAVANKAWDAVSGRR